MKIRFLTDEPAAAAEVRDGKERHLSGEIADIDDALAQAFLDAGIAEPAEPQPAKSPAKK